MPHWDFKCVKCGAVHDWSFLSFAEMERVSREMWCGAPCYGRVQRLIAAPQFEVKGFREENGYASPSSHTTQRGSVKTTLSGNLEILRDLK